METEDQVLLYRAAQLWGMYLAVVDLTPVQPQEARPTEVFAREKFISRRHMLAMTASGALGALVGNRVFAEIDQPDSASNLYLGVIGLIAGGAAGTIGTGTVLHGRQKVLIKKMTQAAKREAWNEAISFNQARPLHQIEAGMRLFLVNRMNEFGPKFDQLVADHNEAELFGVRPEAGPPSLTRSLEWAVAVVAKSGALERSAKDSLI